MCLYLWDYAINYNGNGDEKEIDQGFWHGHKYSKYKKSLSMVMLIYIKQNLSNIWSSIHEKVKQHWGWIEKKRCL